MIRHSFFLAASLGAGTVARAAEQSATATPPASGMLSMLMGMGALLALIGGAAWLLKRMGIARPHPGALVKVIGGANIGSRERILVVEIADQWIVVGVAPGRISTLSTMPRQELPEPPELTPVAKNFAMWLKQTIDKRNDKQQQ